MKIKKTLVITLFLLCILMIGAVNASSTDDTVASSDVNDNAVSSSSLSHNKVTATHNTDKVKKTINSNKTKKTNNNDIKPLGEEEYNPKSFKALNKTINNASSNSEIELDMDYTYDNHSDSDFKYGINITKSITIKSNGITIDADYQARIFNIQPGVVVIIKNINFVNGYVNSPQSEDPNLGGAAIFNDGKLTLENVGFHNNTAIRVGDESNGKGGAIYTTGSSQTDIINCIFTHNNATYDGGAIYANDTSKINMNNSKFIQNTAKESGGAIYTNDTATIIINNTEFNNNIAYSAGAICTAGNSQATIENSNFTKNTADNAGALYISKNAITTITNIQFINNTATKDGGAIINYGELNITNNTFSNNKAIGKKGDGGAINVGSHATTTIIDSIFNNNGANRDAGAIYNPLSNLTIINTQFNNNTADRYGGAIYAWNNTNLNITNSNFTKNKDSNITAIYIANGTNDTINIYHAQFLDNNVTCQEGSVDLSECTIKIRILTNFIIEKIADSTIDKPIIFNITEVNGFTGEINVTIGTQNYTFQIVNGKLTKEILISEVGTYRAIITYSGGEDYKEATAESNLFTIRYPTEFTIKIGNSTIDKPVTINVTEINGFTGEITLTIGTQNYIVQLTNGNGTKEILINKVGTYQATLEFPETETYNKTTTKSNKFNIKYPTKFKITNIPNITEGISIDLYVNEDNHYTGNVDVTIGTKKYTLTLEDGFGHMTVTPDLAPGIYNAEINFKGNTEYWNATAKSNEFLMYKFAVKVTDSTIDKPIAIDVTEVTGFNGTINVKIGTQKYNVELTNGKGTTKTIINKVGIYQAIVEFEGKETTTKSNEFSINYPTEFKIADIPDITQGISIDLIVTEKNKYTGNVVVTIGTKKYTVTLDNGYGKKTVTPDLAPGIYNAEINFKGNTEYLNATAKSNEFLMYKFVVKITNSTTNKPVTIKVTEVTGFTGKINVKIGTQRYNVELTNGKGTTKATINKVGIYQAIVEFEGKETTIKSNEFIIKYLTEFKIADIPDITQGISIDLVVTEKNKYTGDVVVTVGTKKYTVTLDNGFGQKTVTPDLAPGIYNAEINFKGNAEYCSDVAESNDFLMYKFVVKITNSTTDKPVTINVTEVNGFTGKIVVKIGTQWYDVELKDGEGTNKAVINKVGAYKATLEFEGEETSTTSNKFNIKYPTKFIIGKISDFIKGSSIKLNIKEKNNYTGDVVVTIGTKKYTVALKAGVGQKTVTPNLAPGIYNAKINFKGNAKYWNATSQSNKFTIKSTLNPKDIVINISSKIFTQVFNVNDVNYVCYIKDKKRNYFDGKVIVTFYDTASSDVTLKKKYTPLPYTWIFNESDKISGFWLLNNNKLVLRKTITSSSELKNLNIINSTRNSALYKKLFKGEDKGKSVLCVFNGLDFSSGFDKVTKIRVTYSRNGEPKNLTKIKSVKFIHDIPKPVTLTLKKVNVKKSSKKLVLSATLKKGNKAIKNKSVTFNFNGKKYVRSTDKKGVAKVTITKQVLEKLKVGKKIKYQVSYNGKTTKRTAIVKE